MHSSERHNLSGLKIIQESRSVQSGQSKLTRLEHEQRVEPIEDGREEILCAVPKGSFEDQLCGLFGSDEHWPNVYFADGSSEAAAGNHRLCESHASFSGAEEAGGTRQKTKNAV